MYYDLNLAGDKQDALVQRERAAMAVRLGYDCLATSHQAADRLTERDRRAMPPRAQPFWSPTLFHRQRLRLCPAIG
jgi:hypothetical protein